MRARPGIKRAALNVHAGHCPQQYAPRPPSVQPSPWRTCSLYFWIIVPIAPSMNAMRSRNSASSGSNAADFFSGSTHFLYAGPGGITSGGATGS